MASLQVFKHQFFDVNGNPLSGGKVYTYEAGTTTPLATYTDFGEGTPNANPVILNSRGEASIWMNGNYKIKVTDSADVDIYTVDNIDTSGGFVTLVGVETLTNKTLTSPEINGGTINNASIVSATISGTDGNFYASSYTPTAVNGTNVAASTTYSTSMFMRVGDQVKFDIYMLIDLTAAGEFALTLSLPIASNFTLDRQAYGGGFSIVGAIGAITDNASARIIADVTNDTLQINGYSAETASRGWAFSGSYYIL